MLHVEDSIIIHRPIEEVFAYASDLERFPEWGPVVQEIERTSDGPVRVGTTFREVLHLLGKRFATEHEITEYEPNHRLASRSLSGPVQGTIASTFEPADGGTRMTLTLDGDTKGFFAIADTLVAQVAKRQLAASLGTVKDLLESGVGAQYQVAESV